MTRAVRLSVLCLLLLSRAAQAQQAADVPYVPTPWNVVAAMLEIAQVSASAVLDWKATRTERGTMRIE